MAFNMRRLSVLAYANGFTLWHYKAADDMAAASAAGYFSPARDLFAPGDLMMVSGPAGGRIVVVGDCRDELSLAPLG
jgi:hypothetical protein